MKKKLSYFLKLLTGNYIPFLIVEWNDQDKSILSNWLKENFTENYVKKLHKKLSSYFGKEYMVTLTNSGRSAIYLALKSLDLQDKAEVILPSYSCLGVIEPVLKAKLTPNFVDVDDDLNIEYDSVKKVINKNTKVIILPHLGGKFAKDTFKIIGLAKKKGIFVIEDVSQSFGLQHNNKPAGLFGDFGVFSSGIGKTIFSCGGGWLISKSQKSFQNITLVEEEIDCIKDRIIKFKNSFSEKKLYRSIKKLNFILFSKILSKRKIITTKKVKNFNLYKMNQIEAAFALSQINDINKLIKKRKANANKWLKLIKNYNLNYKIFDNNNVYNKLYINGKDSKFLNKKLTFSGIELESGYTPLHLNEKYKKYKKTLLPYTEKIWASTFSLPTRPSLNKRDWKMIEKSVLKQN